MNIRYKLKRMIEVSRAYWMLIQARFYIQIHKDMFQRKIWLISEKRDEARDNGYWLFKYIKENHSEIEAYYVIRRGASDRKKLALWEDSLIEPDSPRHCILFLAAEKNISSQNDGAHPFWKILRHKDLVYWKRLANPGQNVFFLQHGVITNEIPHESFDYGTNPMDCFVVSAERERRFILEKYGYPAESVPNLGLCRFDNLYNNRSRSKNAILLMPTWRKWLQPQQSDQKNEEISRFEKSSYYRAFSHLLSDEELLSYLRKNKFEILFYPHYEMQKYLHIFDSLKNDVVRICSKDEFDVQELLIRAKVLITDYSSVFFDFAYMDKPLVYYQFDAEEFSCGHFTKGYFEYGRDGFGPVFPDHRQVVLYIRELLESGCKNPAKYSLREKEFFDRIDGSNCQRNYEYIQNFKRE